MKQELGWWWPDLEQHLIEWMRHPKNSMVLNGRHAYQGKKQVAAIATAQRHAKGPSPAVAIDVGAHVGLWSWNLMHAFQEVHAFEPVAMMRECFERNVTGAGVHLHAVALGKREDSIAMSTDPTSTGDSRICGQGEIPLRTLDSFGIESVDLIKVDCEGYEENVLRGAEQTLRNWRPVVLVEQKRDMATRFGLKPQGAVDFLRSLGYYVERELSGDYLMVPA